MTDVNGSRSKVALVILSHYSILSSYRDISVRLLISTIIVSLMYMNTESGHGEIEKRHKTILLIG